MSWRLRNQARLTRKEAAPDGTLRVLSRIDRAFINIPIAEACDFHCYSHVTDDLGDRTLLSDHVSTRINIPKPASKTKISRPDAKLAREISLVLLHLGAVSGRTRAP